MPRHSATLGGFAPRKDNCRYFHNKRSDTKPRPSIFFLLLLAVIGFGCKDDPPTKPPDDPPAIIELQALDLGITDGFFQVQMAETSRYNHLRLLLDGIPRLIVPFSASDTTIYLDSLLPKRSYSLKAEVYDDSTKVAWSNTLTVITMDTTTHDFIWTIDTLGDGGNSILRDVVIINDSNVWAVGELHMRDSLGQWTKPFDAAHWDGSSWTLYGVTVRLDYGNGSVIISDQSPLRSVYVASPTDIWFVSSVGGVTRLRNDTIWELMQHQLIDGPGGANKIWGTGSNDLYFVSNFGRITHWDGTTYVVMTSGTDTDLLDVWGSPDGQSVYACGYHRNTPGTRLLRYDQTLGWVLAYDGSPLEGQIRSDSLSGTLTTVFLSDPRRLFVGSSSGLYLTHPFKEGAARRSSFTETFFPGFPRSLRGTGPNDLTIVGAYTMIAHFNGSSWRYFDELFNNDIHLNAVSQTRNLICAVGFSVVDPVERQGIVYRGERR